jgi:RNA polymerase sigma factor (TIGR02999 family)
MSTLLAAVRAGEEAARNQLIEAVYCELRRLAGAMIRNERPNHTLQATALVHEALLRLFKGDELSQLDNRRHFFGAAATAMRRVLVEHARVRATEKRGGDRNRVPLDDVLAVWNENHIDLLAFHEALEALRAHDGRQHEFIELHYFAGLPQKDIANLHNLSHTTVEDDLRAAKAYLRRRLGGCHP